MSLVICGGVQTANASVYLLDSVLMPHEGDEPPGAWTVGGLVRLSA